MKIHPITRTIGITFLLGLLPCVQAEDAQAKPEEGKDWVAVPAIGEGLCLNNLFQSNMVIQRDKPVEVWGWATPGEEIRVSFAGQTQTSKTGENRQWRVTFTAMGANATPQNMTIKGASKTLTLENILIGDVWILGGQSNMAMSIGQIEGGNLEVQSANFSQIRHMTVPTKYQREPQKSFSIVHKWDKTKKSHLPGDGYWETCSPDTVGDLSAIGYIFARRIHMATQIPIGVIDTSVGGTTLEDWTPFEVIRKAKGEEVQQWVAEQEKYLAEYDPQKDLERRIEEKKAWIEKKIKAGSPPRPVNQILPSDLLPPTHKAGNLYGGMIAPIAGFSAKGILWHQGYNNCFEGSLGGTRYGQIFPEMIAAWRAAFNDPKLAFGIISLCTADEQNADNYLEKMLDAGPYIREAQFQTFMNLRKAGDKNIGYASSFDLRRSWYHPSLKAPLGERMANWALSTQYGHNLNWEPPYLDEMKVEEGRIVLTFKLKGPLGTNPEGPIVGFAIAGEDGKFQPAKAEFLATGTDKDGKIQRSLGAVELSSPLVPKPIHYRYAWARNPHANLGAGWGDKLPIATQRSDTWTLSDTYKAYTGKDPVSKIDKLEREEIGELKTALKAADLQRRLHEARAFLKEHEGKN